MPRAKQHDFRSFRSAPTAIVTGSPPWHRHQRRARARARGRLHRLLRHPCTSRFAKVDSDLALLENHHSSPFYMSIRRMTWWNNQNGQYWKGAWNVGKGQGKNPGKAKTQGKKKKEPPSKEADQKFPSYDTMRAGESGSSSSTAGSATQESQLKRIMKEMVQSNSVKLSDEAMKLLEEEDGEDFRTEMKRTQVALNKRRKAHARLQRLKEALSTKHEQFHAFKQTLREQLQAQQEKYDVDVAGLQKSIQEAQETLKKVMEDTEENPNAADEKMELPEVEDLETLLSWTSQRRRFKWMPRSYS